jgi:hypothetical protein
MSPNGVEQQPTSSKSRRNIVAVFTVAMVAVPVYLLCPASGLSKMELELVGTWKVPRWTAPGGEIESWVFKEDRTMRLGWMLNGKFVEEPVEFKWSVAGDSLRLHPQGIHVAFDMIERAERFVGYIAANLNSDPKKIVSLTEDELVLDRGGREPEVLIRAKDR